MKDVPTKVDGDALDATEFNPNQAENENIVTDTGQTLNAADDFQLSKAAATYAAKGTYYTNSDDGTHYVLTPVGNMRSPIVYATGMRISFVALNNNLGSCDINVNSLGIKPVKKGMGTLNLSSGDIVANTFVELIYNASGSGWFELYYSTNVIAQSTLPTGTRLPMDIDQINAPPGWIPDKVGTIGNAASGADVRANADCYNLFSLWWNILSYDPIVGGRGATALADFNANKKLNIPTSNARVIANRAETTFVIGDVTGEATHVLTGDELASHVHSYDKVHYLTRGIGGGGDTSYASGTDLTNSNPSGLGLAHNNMQPTYFTNIFIKL